MSLIFDGDGHVVLDVPWIAVNEFTISGVCTYTEDGEAIIGDSLDTKYGLILTATGMQMRVNNIPRDVTLDGIAPNDPIAYSIVRNASNQIVFTANGVSASTMTNASEFRVTRFGTRYQNLFSDRYTGEMSGQLILSQVGDNRTYEMETSTGTTLTDSTNSQDATLTGFTSGGFTSGAGNSAPVVDAGSNQSIDGDSTAQLNPTVTDSDAGDTLTFTWSIVIGYGTLSDPNIEEPIFTPANVDQVATLQLSVFDGTDTVTDTMTITVTATVQAGGLDFDGDGIVTIPAFAAAGEFYLKGKFTYVPFNRIVIGDSVSANDHLACLESEQVRFNMNGNAMVLNLAGIVDGDVVDYTVVRDENNLITFTANGQSTTLTNIAELNFTNFGTYTVNSAGIRYYGTMIGTNIMSNGTDIRAYEASTSTGTTLTDSIGGQDGTLSGFTSGGFIEQNASPTVNAGVDVSAIGGDVIQLAATATDSDVGDTLTFNWTIVGAGSGTFSDDTILNPTFTTANITEVVTLQLAVSDGTVTVTDTVDIDVTAFVNSNPVVNAGADVTASGGEIVQLAATATDPDLNDTLEFTWTQTPPNAGVFSNDSILNPTFTPSNITQLVTLQLAVDDGTTIVTDTMTIDVTAVAATDVYSLQFNGQSSVSIPDWTAADDLDVTIQQKFKENRVIIGQVGSSRKDYIRFGTEANKQIIVNLNGTSKVFTFSKIKEGDRPLIRLTRAAGDNDLHIRVSLGTEMYSDNTSNGATLMFNRFGEFHNPSGADRYNDTFTGVVALNRAGDSRRYNFNTPGAVLVDELNAQDGTLNGFTVGGFVLNKELRLTLATHLKKRDANGNTMLVVSGEIDNPGVSEGVEYSLDQGATWTTLAANVSSIFSVPLVINETHELWVRLTSDNTKVVRAYKVGAALIIYTLGAQSNEAGQGENNQVMDELNPNAPIPLMCRVDEGGDYMLRVVADPTTSYTLFDSAAGNGSQWPAILENYANRGIQVVLYNPAVGGTGIEQWSKGYAGALPAYWQTPEQIPPLLAAMGGPNFNIAYRGEYEIARVNSENMDFDYISFWYDKFTNDIFADFGCKSVWTYPTSIATSNQLVFKAALDSVIANNSNALFGGNMQDVLLLTDQGPGTLDPDSVGDSIHVTTDAQIELVAQARYDAILALEAELGISSGDEPTENPLVVEIAGDSLGEIGELLTIDASASTGEIGSILSFSWALTKPVGSSSSLSGANTSTVTFTADIAGDYTLQLTLTDNLSNSATQSWPISIAESEWLPVYNQLELNALLYSAAQNKPVLSSSVGALFKGRDAQITITLDNGDTDATNFGTIVFALFTLSGKEPIAQKTKADGGVTVVDGDAVVTLDASDLVTAGRHYFEMVVTTSTKAQALSGYITIVDSRLN